MKRKYILAAAVFLGVLVLDLLTKEYIVTTMAYREYHVITSFFNIVHVHNPGAAFGILSDAHASLRLPFFFIVSLIAMVVVVTMVVKSEDDKLVYAAGLGGILGGAVGNFIDRVRYGHVIDFLDFHLGASHWPAFNVADMGISIGVAILLIDAFLETRKEGERRQIDTKAG